MQPGAVLDIADPVVVSYLAAFLTGLLGGVHCVGMCGGIVAALSFGVSSAKRSRSTRMLPFALAYNLGRVSSYVLAGAIVGYLGFAAANWISEYRSWVYLRLTASLLMMGIGLYIAGWWTGLARIERIGAPFWRRIQPVGQRLFPIKRPRQALVLGMLWGWLPCGLVYTALVLALSAGGWQQGALLMASFGAGTLPLLSVMSLASGSLGRILQRRSVRSVAGLLLILFGAWTFLVAFAHSAGTGYHHAVH